MIARAGSGHPAAPKPSSGRWRAGSVDGTRPRTGASKPAARQRARRAGEPETGASDSDRTLGLRVLCIASAWPRRTAGDGADLLAAPGTATATLSALVRAMALALATWRCGGMVLRRQGWQDWRRRAAAPPRQKCRRADGEPWSVSVRRAAGKRSPLELVVAGTDCPPGCSMSADALQDGRPGPPCAPATGARRIPPRYTSTQRAIRRPFSHETAIESLTAIAICFPGLSTPPAPGSRAHTPPAPTGAAPARQSGCNQHARNTALPRASRRPLPRPQPAGLSSPGRSCRWCMTAYAAAGPSARPSAPTGLYMA